MVHSFALVPSDKPTDLSKAQKSEDGKVYADAGFTTLAEQKPRTEVAKSHYPEMGDDREDFLRFCRYIVDIEQYVDDVDEEVAKAIAAARMLKIGDDKVFDAIDVYRTEDGSELLAFGRVPFGSNVLYYLIVQWRVPGKGIDTDGYTTIEEIRELHRKADQINSTKMLRSRKVWGYPLLMLVVLVSAVVIYAPVAKSANWLYVGLAGSFIVCITAMLRVAISKSVLCGIVALIGFVDMIGVIVGLSYLENIGVIK